MNDLVTICTMIDHVGDEYVTHREGAHFFYTIASSGEVFHQSDNFTTPQRAIEECYTQMKIDNFESAALNERLDVALLSQ